jgi:hypothetical protein
VSVGDGGGSAGLRADLLGHPPFCAGLVVWPPAAALYGDGGGGISDGRRSPGSLCVVATASAASQLPRAPVSHTYLDLDHFLVSLALSYVMRNFAMR